VTVSEQGVIDDATVVMRSRFLSSSQRISSHLAWLEAHAEEIRADVRGSIRASAEKIQATLRYLIDQMDRLPEPQWERFKAMLTLLRAQQSLLDSAEALMHRAQANAVPRKHPNPMAVRGSASTLPGMDPSDVEAAARDVDSASGGLRHGGYLGGYLGVVAQGAVSLRLVLLGVVGLGFVFGYMTLTRGGNKQPIATKPAALTIGDIASPASPVDPREGPARIAATLAPRMPPAAGATAIGSTASTSRSSGLAAATVSAPVPSGAAVTGPDAAARGAAERYVPVIFTGKDQSGVLRAFAELQVRYPKLLNPRRAEAQPVDLGQKGVWHRLVVLPPGSRQSALDFCAQLQAAGYERCWVKGYAD
jgi:hypothetical protein